MLKFILMVMMVFFYLKILSWWSVQISMVFMSMIFMFYVNFNIEVGMMGFMMGMDSLSYNMLMLSVWICCLMLLSSMNIFSKEMYMSLFIIMVLMMLLFLMMLFVSMSLVMFYVFFEASLVPTILIIFGWGYQPERLEASIYLIFYTLLASLPMLISLLMIYVKEGTLLFLLIKVKSMNELMFISLLLAFLVKMPMYVFHLWLPSAHVEAPVAGSMILAGVLLKMGGYGLMRMLKLLVCNGLSYGYLIVSLSMIGGFMVSLICMCQVDMKMLIAYSSVAHMSLVLGGMFTFMMWGVQGSLTLMLAHGLCSSGLFFLSNVFYERLGSRSMMINKGVINFMPSLSFWTFMFSVCNMAGPPSLSLMAEISLMNCLVGWCWGMMLLLMNLLFLSGAYTMFMYSVVQHGSMYSGLYSCKEGVLREHLVLIMHWVPLNLLIMSGDWWFLWV